MEPLRITAEATTLAPSKVLPENYVCPISPNEDRVIVYVVPADQISKKAKLWIPEDRQKPLSTGKVVARGADVTERITIGAHVMFPTPAGYEFTYEDVDLKIIRATNIEAWE